MNMIIWFPLLGSQVNVFADSGRYLSSSSNSLSSESLEPLCISSVSGNLFQVIFFACCYV